MLLTAKIKRIEQSVKSDWYTVVLSKTRKGKEIEIPVFFGVKFRESIQKGLLVSGMRIDVTITIYGKKKGEWWNTYVVCDKWREYKKGAARYREVVNQQTGEIFKRKGEF